MKSALLSCAGSSFVKALGVLIVLKLCNVISPAIAGVGHAPWVGETLQGGRCLGRPQGYGPYDYLLRADYPNDLNKVERAHFVPYVEQLKAGHEGISGTTPLIDLAYTLSAWPNHHRALYTAIRYDSNRDRYKFHQPKDYAPAECWLQRASNYSPRDGTVHMLYGILLHKKGYPEKALAEYRLAEKPMPSDPFLRYNIGLLLVDMERYEEAQEYAKGLYDKQFPMPGLKNKLRAAGYWDD